MAVTIAINPNPEPPEVTISPEVLRSLANPLTGCAKSQKYLKVCCCTLSNNCSLVSMGNLREESIAVIKLLSNPAVKLPPLADFKVVNTLNLCKEIPANGEEG